MTTIAFHAPDISCDHCRRAIEGALFHLTGVSSVDVNVPARTVQVEYDSGAVSGDAIKDALEAEGYPASEA